MDSRALRRKKYKAIRARAVMLTTSALAISCLLSSCTFGLPDKNEVEFAPVAATDSGSYYTVEPGAITATLTGTGKIVATKTTSLYFHNVSGPLEKLNFKLNDPVKAGELFAEIKPEDLLSRIELQKLAVEKGKLRLQQMDGSDIDKLKLEVELAQMQLEDLIEAEKETAQKNEWALKKAELSRQQSQIQLESSEKSKQIAEAEAAAAKDGASTQMKLRLEIADLSMRSAQLSIDVADLTLEEIRKSNDQKAKDLAREIERSKLRLENLKSQLATAQKNLGLSQKQAELEQQTAELTLKQLEQSLQNSKLYVPVDGVVSFMSNVTATDIVSSGQLLAKIANPNELVLQFTALDAKYVTEATSATLMIGGEKYEVDIYTPQPGDLLEQGTTNATNNMSSLYLKFKQQPPELKFNDLVQAQLEVKKDKALVIPKTSIRIENGKILVNVLRDKEVVSVEIARGIEGEQTVEVVNGLVKGDRIVRR